METDGCTECGAPDNYVDLMHENAKMRAALADCLSVRDQFAMHAMQGMWASDQPGWQCSGKPDALRQRAAVAYAQADAMLEVRSAAGVAERCPACKGSGWVNTWVADESDRSGQSDYREDVTCPDCDGTGEAARGVETDGGKHG